MSGRADHRDAVERDYNQRVDQWRSIYDGTSFHDWAIRVRLERALAIIDGLAVRGPVLDVGCGGGQLLALLAERGQQVAGTDLAAGMVEATKALLAAEGLAADGRAADVHQAGADALPFDDSTFGAVTALGLVEYVEEPARAVAEMARVLVPGGHLIVTAPNPARLAYLLDPVGTVVGRFRPPPAGYRRHYWTPRGLRRLVRDAGLTVVALQGHAIGPLTFAGRQLVSDRRAIAMSTRLERSLPGAASTWLGANTIAHARKP